MSAVTEAESNSPPLNAKERYKLKKNLDRAKQPGGGLGIRYFGGRGKLKKTSIAISSKKKNSTKSAKPSSGNNSEQVYVVFILLTFSLFFYSRWADP